jgi:hypothetical protein
MPVTDHLKPLFNARLLGEALREAPAALNDERRRIAATWAASAASGALLGQKEKPPGAIPERGLRPTARLPPDCRGRWYPLYGARNQLQELIETHRHYAEPERARAARVRALEGRLSDLVIQAYSLTDDEIELLWRTAPPRMPVV